MNKLKDIIAYILKQYPFKDDLSNARLTKILYLSDWKNAIDNKNQITNIGWFFDTYGPYVQDISQEIKENRDIFSVKEVENVLGGSRKIFYLTDKKYEPSLSKEEKLTVEHVIKETSSLSWDEFIKLVYATHPISSSERYTKLDLVKKANEYTQYRTQH